MLKKNNNYDGVIDLAMLLYEKIRLSQVCKCASFMAKRALKAKSDIQVTLPVGEKLDFDDDTLRGKKNIIITEDKQ